MTVLLLTSLVLRWLRGLSLRQVGLLVSQSGCEVLESLHFLLKNSVKHLVLIGGEVVFPLSYLTYTTQAKQSYTLVFLYFNLWEIFDNFGCHVIMIQM